MSNGSRSLALTAPGHWEPSNEHRSTSSDFEDPWNGHVRVSVPQFVSYRTNEGGGMYAPWRIFEERVRTGPYGLSRFPSQPYSPIRVLVLDNSDEAVVNPRLRRFIQDSPPRIRGEWQLGLPSQEQEDPGLTEAEFKMAMKKMKKQEYNPVYPKRRYWRRGLFNNWSSNSSTAADGDGRMMEGKDCAICLESFVLNEQVLLTPCNHMFHNDCLVPWVKSHGKCPVCRSMFYEKKRSSSSTSSFSRPSHSNSNNDREINSGTRGAEDVAVDLLYLIRAMEEAYNWVNLTR